MTERWLYFALGVTTVISLGAVTNQLLPAEPAGVAIGDTGITFPDGTVQTSAAAVDPRRSFFLTNLSFEGGEAGTACGSGYRMAQLWEILDPSNLRYATEAPGAFDRGIEGPIPASRSGWIRTGWGSTNHPAQPAGMANCNGYSSSASNTAGTTVTLGDAYWNTEASAEGGYNGWLGPWVAGKRDCSQTAWVWCISEEP